MVAQTEIVGLKASQVQDAGGALGRAFWDDPSAVYVLPDDSTRIGPLSEFFVHAARYATLFGNPFTTSEKVDGAALWLPPGEWEMPEERMGEAGLDPSIFGPDGAERFATMFGHLETLHLREPHWYLFILGVDPPRQGQGLGGALMAPVLSRADAEGLPCYLETMKARNVPFYQKHGFEVVVEADLPNGALHFWTMKRSPRK